MGGAAVGILVVVGLMMVLVARRAVEGATWCIARSSASATALQTALDFACGAGADCLPIQASGLCYLPNTLPAHASYAFNSYYQRSNAAPGSCDFAGTATVSVTDPSYGSCTYPSSKSTAGGSTSNTPNFNTPTNTPINAPIGGTGGGIGGLSPPGFGTTVPNYGTSYASRLLFLLLSTCIGFLLLLL
ncbi:PLASMODESMATA CALLOSE-BINDING PROTEIN 3-like isoform X1 [Phoenix dactylifera]|uniref:PLASMODESMATA CALLOSE-BINDING PROTEIN 3-like isoform X1 n=1 Tax=Phoenix dactylifera TaxID=42345 RepID=A0A8B7D0S1_PHODC|nr:PLASMODESMATA CALLOSE-BINDING PROTEIN 3-like isoform X1 [Phoenix dactylifera]